MTKEQLLWDEPLHGIVKIICAIHYDAKRSVDDAFGKKIQVGYPKLFSLILAEIKKLLRHIRWRFVDEQIVKAHIGSTVGIGLQAQHKSSFLRGTNVDIQHKHTLLRGLTDSFSIARGAVVLSK